MAVLKRVCEENPRPIRESNPETPGWLAAIIARLHAKNPADRFQSANEVAELLGRCLAHLQTPAAVPLPAGAVPTAPRPPGGEGGRRRWSCYRAWSAGWCWPRPPA